MKAHGDLFKFLKALCSDVDYEGDFVGRPCYVCRVGIANWAVAEKAIVDYGARVVDIVKPEDTAVEGRTADVMFRCYVPPTAGNEELFTASELAERFVAALNSLLGDSRHEISRLLLEARVQVDPDLAMSNPHFRSSIFRNAQGKSVPVITGLSLIQTLLSQALGKRLSYTTRDNAPVPDAPDMQAPDIMEFRVGHAT